MIAAIHKQANFNIALQNINTDIVNIYYLDGANPLKLPVFIYGKERDIFSVIFSFEQVNSDLRITVISIDEPLLNRKPFAPLVMYCAPKA